MGAEDMTLEDIISDIESGGRKFALRFEPHVFKRTQESNRYEPMVNLAKARNWCSRDTACVIVSTSFGKFQIMGFNLYDAGGLNYPNSVGEYLSDDMQQAGTFRTFCQARNIYFSPADLVDEALALRFARVYNGADEYAKKIASRLVTS